MMSSIVLVAVLLTLVCDVAGCTTDLDCSLNGVCGVSGGGATVGPVCVCDRPWQGSACGVLGYATTTPAVAKSLYNLSDPRNTWNGPIVGPIDGKYHMYNPIYDLGSLLSASKVMHGVADAIEGPYNWSNPVRPPSTITLPYVSSVSPVLC